MQNKEIDFTGQTIYVGIDVHLRRWKVALLWDRKIIKRFSQDAKVDILLDHLGKNYPGAKYFCGYEAGFCGFGIHRQLKKEGVECLVLHAADIPTTDKERRQKTDARDCRKIAICLANPLTKGIHVPSIKLQEDRNVSRLRAKISKDCTRARNRIKSLIYLMSLSFEIPAHWSGGFIKQLQQWAQEHQNTALLLAVEEYAMLRKLKTDALKALRKLSKQPEYATNIKLLHSVPGMGLVHSMAFLTETGDIRRFKHLDQLCSMVGLIPDTNASGEKEGVGRITKRGKKEIKNILIEAAWIAIRYDPGLNAAFVKYTQRMNKNQAIIRIAKKLLNRIRTILIKQSEYRIIQ